VLPYPGLPCPTLHHYPAPPHTGTGLKASGGVLSAIVAPGTPPTPLAGPEPSADFAFDFGDMTASLTDGTPTLLPWPPRHHALDT
jgi:hypothetical protein